MAEIRSSDKAALESQVWNQVQARYGEKPKEARQVKKSLDKDDFMRIMLTEMKNQDPTKPMDAERMSQQMAQLTTVEQLNNMGKSIEKLADKNSAQDRLAMSSMIGKSVTVDKSRFAHQKGAYSNLNFNLPSDAPKIKVTVLDEIGEEVFAKELEPRKQGQNSFNWDGVNSSGLPSRSGTYTVRVDAENDKGGRIQINPISNERIVGVSFEGGQTQFLVGDMKAPQKVQFNNIIKMELSSADAPGTAAPSEGTAVTPAESNQPFSLPKDLMNKVAAEAEEKGFPSGLGSETSEKKEG
jgi:flagellar basal-body rod modification protein FlgD